ncbi:MAG: CotH kinase family protein [Thermoleophilia bacterium]|nr:CotH kinase family protein [Thermoleophilia bacterium]
MRLAVAHTMRHLFPGLIVTAALCVLGAAAAGCAPTTAAAQGTSLASTTSTQAAPEAGLFDISIVHEISVSFEQADYDAMVQTFQESGDKDWIEATVTIDGRTYENVGMRLKGNSSIMGLRGGGAGPMGGGANAGGNQATGGNQAKGGARSLGGDASTDAPETLPWLIDLDKNVDNQNHEGVVELAVRSNTSETALNEAVSLALLREAGLASEEATYVSFSINGRGPRLRLVIENPDDLWMADEFDISGALYKAESTGDYSYRGEDPDSYDDVFDQEAGKTNADLTPLIEFLDFINSSDDDAFNAGLPERLDVEAFATYLAVQELIANSDDIDGPGNNSYLYYDTKTDMFTVVAWDHNLAFGGMGGAGRFEGGGAAGRLDDGETTTRPRADREGFDGSLREGMELPDGQAAAGRGFGGKSNILVQRFKANPEWQQLYEERLAGLRSTLYESGKAAEILAAWVAVLKTGASNLVDAATVDQEAATISEQFTAD